MIGDHVRIGSDTMLVAPVSIGDGAYTAAGSVITDDVPAGAMGVGRARQRTIRRLGASQAQRLGVGRGGRASAAGNRQTHPPKTIADAAGDNAPAGTGEGRDTSEGTG